MRILVISDLHLDQDPDYAFPAAFPDHDLAVFAGDVGGPAADGVRLLASLPQLAARPVVMVAGNHEFYGREIGAAMVEAQEAAAGTNVALLDRNVIHVGDRAIVGTTLWTDYRLFGQPEVSMLVAARAMNDHRLVKTVRDGRVMTFTPRDARMRHARERAWLSETLDMHGPGSIVVTHHAPHPRSVHRRYATDAVTPAFASDLTSLIRQARPALWVHGHTHDSFDYEVGATRVVCNPKGYTSTRGGARSYENARFDEAFVVEVP